MKEGNEWVNDTARYLPYSFLFNETMISQTKETTQNASKISNFPPLSPSPSLPPSHSLSLSPNLFGGGVERVELRLVGGDVVGENLVFGDFDFDPLGVAAASPAAGSPGFRFLQRPVGPLQPRLHLVQRVLELAHAEQTVLKLVPPVAHRILEARPSARADEEVVFGGGRGGG